MYSKPEDVLNAWLTGVNNYNLPAILSLYHDTAVLIPTFSNRLLIGLEQIQPYFEALAENRSPTIMVDDDSRKIDHIDQAIYNLYGTYTWQFNANNSPEQAQARFTYTVNLALPRPILHHHSSQVPENL